MDGIRGSAISVALKYAGNGGFQVSVKENTDLKGAVLASTADAGKNSLTTGTLTTSDIENKAEYSSSSSTIAGSFDSGQSLLKNGVNTLAATAAGSAQKAIEGDAAGTTKSAIANGTVTITNAEAQKEKTGKPVDETLASLNRDTDGANQAIDKIFDAKKVKEQQEENKVRAELVQQLAPMVYSKVGDMLVGSSPDTKAAVHALMGGLLAQAAGGSFAAGAAGGAAASLAMEAFGKALLDQPGLSESDRKALVQLAGLVVGGVAGGAAGGSVADVAAGANIGKVATENNYLNHEQKDALAKELLKCQGEATCVTRTVSKYQNVDQQQHADAQSCSDPTLCKDVSLEARRGGSFDRNDAVFLCGGVSSCESYLTNLGSQNKTDEFSALRRAEQVQIALENAVTKGTLVDALDITMVSGASFGTGGGAIAGATAGRKPANSGGTSAGGGQQGRMSGVADLFDKNSPVNEISLNGQRYTATADSNKAGTTKVFDTSRLPNTQLESQARAFVDHLTGGVPLSPKGNPPQVWTTTLADGTTINLRSVSSSTVGTSGNQARWTVDVINNPSIQAVVPRPRIEIKFK